jgi:putative hydrolase of the HAD superfamily
MAKQQALIKTIIFDVQQVVVSVRPDNVYFQHLANKSGKTPEYFQKPWFLGLYHQLEEGKITLGSFLKSVSSMSGMSIPDMRWLEFYREGLRLNKSVISLISRLRKNYTVVAFTNMDIGRYAVTLEALDPATFDKFFISYKMGVRKPKSEAFRKVLDELRAKPKETIFIDDRQENLEGAKAVGIQTVLFTDEAALEKDLLKFGVKIQK